MRAVTHPGPFADNNYSRGAILGVFLACVVSVMLSGCGSSAKSQVTEPNPTLTQLTCSSGSITGAVADDCTVSLTLAAASNLPVGLASNNPAVVVPTSVAVPGGSISANFTANVTAVGTAQKATLTATAGGVSKTYVIDLNAAIPSLSLSATSLNFGDVAVNASATRSLQLSSAGTAPLTITAATVSGKGFSASGVSFPVTLNPAQTATLSVAFAPLTSGAANGLVTLTSNDGSQSTATVALSGTGQTTTVAYKVTLNWDPPSTSSVPVVGYNVFRAAAGTSTYRILNSSSIGTTAYTDTTVQSGASYKYYVESIDSAGNLSAPSNAFSVSVP